MILSWASRKKWVGYDPIQSKIAAMNNIANTGSVA